MQRCLNIRLALRVGLLSALLLLGFGWNPTFSAPVSVRLAPGVAESEIQKALDRLPAGGEIVLGPAIYRISTPLFLRHDNETLRGSGPRTVLLLADGADCPVV